jgi:hypothetical protein
MLNTDSLFIICTESGTILPLASCFIVDLTAAPEGLGSCDSETIEYAEANGKPIVQELGL